MRIVQPSRMPCSGETAELLAAGVFQVVNGDIVEPIEMFRSQERASNKAVREHQRTGCPHKVVMNAEI